jgi:hypothetical protein
VSGEKTEDTDKAYHDAIWQTMGKAYAEMFKAMLDGGMSRHEALTALVAQIESANAAASRPKE